MNGKEGDHPYTDIVVHHIEVFGEGIDDLVRELDAIGGFESEIARDWLWIQAENLQEANDAQDAKRARSVRDWVERYLDHEIHRLHRTQEPGLET